MNARRRSLVLIISAAFLVPLAGSIYMPNIGNVSAEFGYTYFIPLTVTGYVLAEALSYLVYGPLSDRYGRRKVYVPALYGFTVSCVLCYLSWSAGILVLFRIFQGLCVTTGFAVGSAVIADVYHPSVRGKAMGTFFAFPLIAPPIGFFLGGFIGSFFGWRYVFLLLAVVGLSVAILFTLFFEETKSDFIEERGMKKIAFGVLRNRRFASSTFLGVSLFATLYTFLVFFAIILSETYGLDSFGIGLIFMGVAFADSIFAYIGGRLSDIFSRQRVFTVGSILCIIGTFMFSLSIGLQLVYPSVFYLLFAVGLGLSSPALITYVLETAPDSTGTASGIYNFLRSTGAAALTFGGYFIIESFSLKVLFFSCASMIFITLIYFCKHAD